LCYRWNCLQLNVEVEVEVGETVELTLTRPTAYWSSAKRYAHGFPHPHSDRRNSGLTDAGQGAFGVRNPETPPKKSTNQSQAIPQKTESRFPAE
jgi:hypothetical protein